MEQTHRAKQYQELVSKRSPKSQTGMMVVRAFLVGGFICALGQGIRDLGEFALKLNEDDVAAFCCIVLIFVGATLTGVGVYDNIGKFAGAGSVVPITGFANSIVAPAMEHRCEGLVLGLAANMFSIAGPVIVYGVITSIVIGILHFFFG